MITFDQAMDAVCSFEKMAYFNTISEGGRVKIAEELMEMVNWPPERILTTWKTGHEEPIPYVEPFDRLKWLIGHCKRVAEWPGMADIRGLYCKKFKPADNIEMPTCNIPGYTDDECHSGVDFLSLERSPEQVYLPQPGDEKVDMSQDVQRVAASLRGR